MTLFPEIGTDDLYDIYSELLPVANKWRNIGLALWLTPNVIGTIGTKNDAKDCLLEVLTEWLKKTYNVKRFGEPSWKLLIMAVGDQAGGGDPALAEKIAHKYKGITWYIQVDTIYMMDSIYNNCTSFFPLF